MKVKVISNMIIILSLFIFCKEVLSWNEDVTHMDLANYATEHSVLNKTKGDYLRNLGFQDGLEENLQNKTVSEWIQEGAKQEDIPTTRSLNHFHNPYKPWEQAGLNDKVIFIPVTGMSSLRWAQNGTYQLSSAGEDWSWQTTRHYFYLALTSATDSIRQENFAKTFLGLGHQMHLLQDMAVPDHVRNDAHPEDAIYGKVVKNGGAFFESWAKSNRSRVNNFASDAALILFPDVSFNVSHNGLAPTTQLFDAEEYNGTNPSASLTQGLSEYTTANFFSGDTVFAAERYSTDHRHYFPYPRRASTDILKYLDGLKPTETIVAEDGKSDSGVWISKIADGENIDHFVKAGLLSKASYRILGEGELFYSSFVRDEQCHEDYAQKLIPRAVGYSAGLLNYFFRGDIDMIPDDVTGSGYVIVNNTDEDMSGSFELWYDDKSNERKLVRSDHFSIGKKSSGNNTSANITFAQPGDAKEPCKYILVFQGQMGSEQNAVAGRLVNTLECIEGRIVVLQKIDPLILVGFNNETLQTYLPRENFERAVAVRFDVENADVFAVLAVYNGEYVFHKFHIDAAEKVIRYDGIIGPRFKGYSYSIPAGFSHMCCEVFEWVESDEYSEGWNIIDFYFKGGSVKPFGSYSSQSAHRFSYPGDARNIESTVVKGILFGKTVFEKTFHCTNGSLSIKEAYGDGYNDPDHCPPNTQWWHYCDVDFDIEECTFTEDPIAISITPIAIFNESDYAYGHYRLGNFGEIIEKEINSTLPISLPEHVISNQYISTMLRKNGKYSFCTRDPYNRGFPEVSYSSEIGIVDCSGFLIGEYNIGWWVEPWHAEVGKFKDCSDWKSIFPASISPDFESNAIYDVSPLR